MHVKILWDILWDFLKWFHWEEGTVFSGFMLAFGNQRPHCYCVEDTKHSVRSQGICKLLFVKLLATLEYIGNTKQRLLCWRILWNIIEIENIMHHYFYIHSVKDYWAGCYDAGVWVWDEVKQHKAKSCLKKKKTRENCHHQQNKLLNACYIPVTMFKC